jgi:hypothetical protein
MATPSNNLPPKSNSSVTTEYFNNFFKPDLSVSQNVDDAVIGYFESITGEKEAARVLASTVLYTALTQGIDPMSIVDELKKLSQQNRLNAPDNGSSYNENLAANTDPNATPGPPPRKNNLNELDAYLTMLLNLNRAGTSLLGISNQPQTNKYVQRAILP